LSFASKKVSRGTNEPPVFELFDFNGLLNINALPQSIQDNQLNAALNVYGTVDGGVTMRRGMAKRGNLFGATAGRNVVRFFQQVVSGAPVNPARLFLLGQADGGIMWNVDTGTQIGATGALGAAAKSWSTARIYDPATAGGTDILVICTGSGGPYLFDGTTISTPSTWAAFAGGARWCQVANGTLWFGGIPAQPTVLIQMAIGAPQTYQELYVASYPITGLSVLGAGSQSGLVFGMTRGLGVSFGVNSTTLYVQEIPHEDGVAAGRTMIAIGGVVYFLGRFNIYVFDGQNIVPIGDNVRPWIINDPIQQDYPMNGDRSLSFSWYYNDLIMFAYDSGGVGYCNTYLVWHLKQRGWTVYSGPKLSGATLLDAPGDAFPTSCVTMDALTAQAYNWDVYNATGPNGHGVDDAGQIIVTSVLSKYFRLAGAGTRARLLGVAPELFVEQFAGNIVLATDYGSASYTQALSAMSQGNALVWDQGNWDQTVWGGNAFLTYAVQNFQVDDNQVAKAFSFAFGIATNDQNPPYRFAGISGEFAVEGRSYD
jgi:hypothetical protein